MRNVAFHTCILVYSVTRNVPSLSHVFVFVPHHSEHCIACLYAYTIDTYLNNIEFLFSYLRYFHLQLHNPMLEPERQVNGGAWSEPGGSSGECAVLPTREATRDTGKTLV
jgi:hypothetical protein